MKINNEIDNGTKKIFHNEGVIKLGELKKKLD